jgi:hypothetical protein
MTRKAEEEPVDERLRQLLAVERRLQVRVRNAETDAAHRLEDARREGERVVAAARLPQAPAGEAEAVADRAAHEQCLVAIHDQHEMVLRAITGVSDERIDELARRALDRAIGGDGAAT